jgi:hypothetical protein
LGYDTSRVCESATIFGGDCTPRYAKILVEQERLYRQVLKERSLDFQAGDPRD